MLFFGIIIIVLAWKSSALELIHFRNGNSEFFSQWCKILTRHT